MTDPSPAARSEPPAYVAYRSRPEPINAIAYAQYHLRGGARSLCWIFFGTLAAIAALGAISLGTTNNVQRTAHDGANMLLVLQWMTLSLFATLRVGASVRQDMTGGMIESHRLTPYSPVSAVLGYAVGSAVPVLALAAAIGLGGVAFTVLAQLPVSFWLVGNITAAGAGLLVWTLVTLLTLMTSNGGLVPGLGFLGVPGIGLVMIVPALSVLAAPLAAQSVWNNPATFSLSPAHVLALVADVLLAGTFTLAAARKYRSGVADAFSIRLSLLLLALWLAITLIGLGRPDLFVGPSYGGPNRDEEITRVIAAVISCLIIAMVPAAAAARAQVMRAEMFPPGRRGWPVAPALAVPLCAIAVGLVTLLAPPMTLMPQRQLATTAVVLAWLASVGFWVALADLRGRTGWALVTFWALGINLLPLVCQGVADFNRPYSMRSGQPEFCFAPIGALINLWGDRVADAWPGVIAQCGYVLLPAAAFFVRRRRDARSAMSLTSLPAAAE